MKSHSVASRLIFVGAIIISGICLGSSASAQTKVALIDVGLIFKSHPHFTEQLNTLKTEADNFKLRSEQAQQTLMKKAEGIRQYQPGSEEFKALETKLAQEAVAIEVEQKSQLRDLMTREARLHFETYQQVTGVIRDYCQQRNIQLVLRYNSEQMDPNQPRSIMDKVNGSVVYFEPQKDVTAEIIQQIKQLGKTANAGGQEIR